jgi:glutathione S-transferase
MGSMDSLKVPLPSFPPPALLGAGSTGRHWGIGSGQTAAQREGFEAHLRGLSASLQRHGGPFLLGTHLTLADVMVYPFLYRFSVAKKFSGYDIGAVLGGRIGEWLAALEARPAFRTTSADSRLLLEAFTAHQSLDFFDYETYTCFQLHPHNQHMLT